MKIIVSIALLSFLLAGCVTTSSMEAEHRKLIGTSFRLQEPWFLRPFDGTSEYEKRATHSVQNKPCTYRDYVTLPQGTEIRIKEINKYRNVSIGDAWVGVILELTDPSSQSPVTTLYWWNEKIYGLPPWKNNLDANKASEATAYSRASS